jgi:tRNA A-37 threonylcarbamoyl transferase component Bud32
MSASDLEKLLRDLCAGKNPAAPLACGRAQAFHHLDVCPAPLAAAIAELANRPPPGLTLYKFGSRSVVGAYTFASGDRVVLKYYYPNSLVKHVTYGVRGSRCMQSWRAGTAFHFIGVPTPAPLVIAEWQRLGGLWLGKSFLATRQADGIALDAFIRSHGVDHPLLAKAVESLRRSFSLMASHRAVHGDLKANNLLVSDTGEVSFIDLDAASVLLPAARWKSLHEKDRQRFHANWKNLPDAAALFRKVFDSP